MKAHQKPTPKQEAMLATRLQQAGLRKTAPRLALAYLLFGGKRTPQACHITAEALYDKALAAQVKVSLATIYNTLNQFCQAGLLRAVVVEHGRSYFDTNLQAHHHFYVEGEQRLIDVPERDVSVARLPHAPKGYDVDSVDVVIRLNARAK